jgi:hypothetical protein
MGNHRHERPETLSDIMLLHVRRLLSAEVLVGIIHCLLTAAAVFGWVEASGGH